VRGIRSFGVMLVVLIALGGYLYFVESKRTPGDGADKKDKAFAVEADKIEEFTVKSESGERTTLRKNGADWQIVEPAAGKPDAAEVSGITTNLSTLEIQRVIDENPSDLAEFNLAQPRVEVTFKAAGKDHKLLIGRKTPPGSDLYAKLDDQTKVVLIPAFVDTTFNRTTFDLRDKSVLSVNRDEVGSIAVATSAGTLRFEKGDGEWKIAQPPSGRADFSAIEGLVSRLTTLQMKSVAAPTMTNPAEYGLDKPAATVTLGSGSSQAVLAIGKAAGEGTVFARDLAKPAVVTIDASLLDDLKKGATDYRQKDLFDARAFNATRLELARGGVTTVFEKTTAKNKDGQEQSTWKQVAPAAKDADQAKVENLISALTQAQAASFVEAAPKAASDKPELTVTLTSNEGKRHETVAFGRFAVDLFAIRTGEPGAAKIEATTFDNIITALEALK
jgi:uncharacterized protein DUF4340